MRASNQSHRGQDADDGVLTALEVLGLDLLGTELVTLSACQTGVGEVRAGRGVFGLRRAFALAGARSLMMSLWPVADEATGDLMVSWYKQIQEGVPGDEALRRIQLAAISGELLPEIRVTQVRGVRPQGDVADPELVASRHPYYWAGFVFVGAGRSITDAAASARSEPRPSTRGHGEQNRRNRVFTREAMLYGGEG